MTGRTDRWITRTTTGCVGLLAVIAGTVSYLHMHELVALHGQPGWLAALTPLSVDGMIVAASTTLLADSRSGRRGGVLPWILLFIGSAASLAANVAVAEPTVIGRVIAVWPSFALIGSYELLMRQIRTGTQGLDLASPPVVSGRRVDSSAVLSTLPAPEQVTLQRSAACPDARLAGSGLKQQAWEWALAHRDAGGVLPTGKAIGIHFGRRERWGRLAKREGLTSQSQLASKPQHEDGTAQAGRFSPFGKRQDFRLRQGVEAFGSRQNVWSPSAAAVPNLCKR